MKKIDFYNLAKWWEQQAEKKIINIDGHEITIFYLDNFYNKICKIEFLYFKNILCTSFLYDFEKKSFSGFEFKNVLTKRQEKILSKKIDKILNDAMMIPSF